MCYAANGVFCLQREKVKKKTHNVFLIITNKLSVTETASGMFLCIAAGCETAIDNEDTINAQFTFKQSLICINLSVVMSLPSNTFKISLKKQNKAGEYRGKLQQTTSLCLIPTSLH